MNSVELIGSCKQERCTFRQDSICLEGFQPPETPCPHYFTEQAEQIDDEETTATLNMPEATLENDQGGIIIEPIKTIELHHGLHLELDEARQISGRNTAKLIVLAGEKDVGKTTIITAIYDNLIGQVSQFMFSGSQTLPGLEARCHGFRVTSERHREAQERTDFLDDPIFLHLAFKSRDPRSERIDVLMTDLAGEQFRRLVNSKSEAMQFQIALQSTTFVLLLDGKKLSHAAERHAHVELGIGILRSLLTAGVLDEKSSVMVLINKLDCVSDDATYFIQHREQELKSEFESRFFGFNIQQIAARPDPLTTSLEQRQTFMEGIDAVVGIWLQMNADHEVNLSEVQCKTPATPACAHWFDVADWSGVWKGRTS
jgi:hypothetical protein